MRARVGTLRSAAVMADSRTAGSLNKPQFLGRLSAVRLAAERAAAAVEKVLPSS